MSTAESICVDKKPMSFDLLQLINEARMQYGLRHHDYQRYREHCTRRVHRLRQMLSLTEPNSKKVNKKKELPEQFDDVRYLHLFVYETERAWAYSMELKQESTNSLDTRKRHHLTKRLKRAVESAKQLYVHCEQQVVDPRTLLYAKAYAATIQGYLDFEQQQWSACLASLLEARTIYDRFATTSHSTNPQQASLAYAAIDDMDANLRFCAYKLQCPTDQDMDTLIASLKKQHSLDALESQLTSTLGVSPATTQDGRANNTFLWRYEPLTLTQPALADAVHHARDVTGSLDLSNTDDDKQVVERYDAVLSAWADVEKRVKKLVKEDKEAAAKVASTKSSKASEQMAWVQTFVTYHYYAYTIQRNKALLSTLEKTQHRIKLWDDILKQVGYIQDLTGVKERHAFESELDILTGFFKAQRCLLVAVAYVDSQMMPEALALYQRAQTHLVQTKQLLQQSRGFDDEAVLKVTPQDLQSLEISIQSGIWKAQAQWYLHHDDQPDSTEKEVASIDDNEVETLIQRLDTYPTSLTTPGQKVPRLINFPPKFQPAPCKPFYFDLAANHIRYPEALQERASAEKGSGLWKFFGFGGAN
ncbi:hypothetical protein DM01DRAFT_1385889 [Hesseltinella vesiculosa]|uniref:Signal recognition particle subunit SRP68 n=1 Tax=Hesseltinella vesiculosa TaxID=101127 RepID=A0A1X2G866_9FUNG|nr:hypothetical protein DM01DRAFT_1385889 [Hesseltinella vesiculosa]